MKADTFQVQNITNMKVLHSHTNQTSDQSLFPFRFTQYPPSFNSNQPPASNVPFQPYQRYSQDVTSNPHPHSNNAFVHLRNQISNLRSQFSKLIQKDHSKTAERAKQDGKDIQKKGSPIRRFSRTPTFPTFEIKGKVSQFDQREEIPQPSNQNLEPKSRFMSKDSQNREQIAIILEKNVADFKGVTLAEDNKVLVASGLDKKASEKSLPQTTEMQSLQSQVAKLNHLRKQWQEKQLKLIKQLNTKQKEYNSKLFQKSNELQKLKLMLDQENTNLALKSSLVEKLQVGISKLQKQNRGLLNESIERFQQWNKQKEKYQKEMQLFKETQRKSIQEISNKYKEASEFLQRLQQQNKDLTAKLTEKDLKLVEAFMENRSLEERIKMMENQLQKTKYLSLNTKQLQLEVEKRSECSSVKLPDATNTEFEAAQELLKKVTSYQQQNSSLQKQVLSYIRQKQELNHANNIIRQKYAHAKQQIKLLRQDLAIKDAHIMSLYRDISMLDSQRRRIPALKELIGTSSKYIEELNQFILARDLSQLNRKYQFVDLL